MSSAAPSKSAQITALVAELKAGRLSKAELFAKLQALQAEGGSATHAAVASASASTAPPTEAESLPPNATSSRRSSSAAAGIASSVPADSYWAQPQQPHSQNAAGPSLYPTSSSGAQSNASLSRSSSNPYAAPGPVGEARSPSSGAWAEVFQGGSGAAGAASSSRGAMASQGVGSSEAQYELQQQIQSSRAQAFSAQPPAPAAAARSNSAGPRRGATVGTTPQGRPQQQLPQQRQQSQQQPTGAGFRRGRLSFGGAGGGGGPPHSGGGHAGGSPVLPSELAECTFHPRISQLPAGFSQVLDAVHFPARVAAWSEHRREEAERRARAAEDAELAQCTFKPAINPMSRAIAEERFGSGGGGGDGGTGAEAPHDRLFRTATSSSAAAVTPSKHGAGTAGGGTFDAATMQEQQAGQGSLLPPQHLQQQQRPHTSGAQARSSSLGPRGSSMGASASSSYGRPLFTSSATGAPPNLAAAAGRPLTREEEELLRECTFRPAVNPTLDAAPVRSRYRDPPQSQQQPQSRGRSAGPGATRPLPSGLEHCTFRPAVNAVRPRAMPSAALYVQAPIYERLARTQTAAQREREQAVVASASSAAAAAAAANGGTTTTSPRDQQQRAGPVFVGGARRASQSSLAREDSSIAVAAAAAERAAALAEFLARQQSALERKAANVEALRTATAPALRPALNPRSLAMFAAKAAAEEAAAAVGAGSGGEDGGMPMTPGARASSSGMGGGGGAAAVPAFPSLDASATPRPAAQQQQAYPSGRDMTPAGLSAAAAAGSFLGASQNLLNTTANNPLGASSSSRGGASSSFLARVSREAHRKETESLKVKARLSRDPECTFIPSINSSSKSMPGRTAIDLSRGDALKRETALRLLKLRREQEELEGTTFAPSINERSRNATGRLRILEEPDSYVARLQAEAAAAAERANRAASQTEASELQECTFKPQTHDAPEYVRRIARSMTLARAVRPSSAPSRPDWK